MSCTLYAVGSCVPYTGPFGAGDSTTTQIGNGAGGASHSVDGFGPPNV